MLGLRQLCFTHRAIRLKLTFTSTWQSQLSHLAIRVKMAGINSATFVDCSKQSCQLHETLLYSSTSTTLHHGCSYHGVSAGGYGS
jgi:hypothetical protein